MIDLINMSVLIVDDIQSMCRSIRGMLKILKFGKTFRFANNGQIAWHTLQNTPIDLAIIDWRMPVMSGIELLDKIRADKKIRDMPVIMITAEANKGIVAQVAESNVDAYLLKPIVIKSLGEKIISVVKKVNDPPPVDRFIRESRELKEAGDIDGAIEVIRKAVSADTLSSRPLREMGDLFLIKNDLEIAEQCFLKALKVNKMDVFAFHRLSEICLKKDDIERAEKCINKALDISPRHVDRGYKFGKVLLEKNLKENALKIFEKVLNLSSNSVELQEEIVDLCMKYEMYEYPIDIMNNILRRNPVRYDIVYKLGVALTNTGEHQLALKHLHNAEKKDKNNVDIKLYLAKNYVAQKYTFRAEEIIHSILKIDPGNEEAMELKKKNI